MASNAENVSIWWRHHEIRRQNKCEGVLGRVRSIGIHKQLIRYQLTEAEWHMYASVVITSDNGLSPVRRQAFILTDDSMLLIGLLGTKFCDISIKMHENVVCKMSAILYRLQCVNQN